MTKGSTTIKGYPLAAQGLWQIAWYEPNGTRKKRAFRDEAEAKRFAAAKASELSGQRSHVRSLTPEETADYEAAIELLPAGERLITAVRFYVERRPSNLPRKTTAEVAAAYLADLERRGMSALYRRQAAQYLVRFGNDFSCPIADVSGPMFREWLQALGVQPKTQKGIRGLVVGMFNFAKSERFVTREHALEIAEVKAPKVVVANIRTMTHGELLKLLAAATPDELPAVALLAFCPLRTAEVARLDWRDVRVSEQSLTVNAAIAKMSVRRVVPIPAAGLAWIGDLARESGPVWPFQPDPDGNRLAHRLPVLAKCAGVPYGKNVIRHSIISALMAIEQDAARVSLWAGNSPRMVATNYSARWTAVQGKAWLAVLPTAPANVMAIPRPEISAEAANG